MKIKILIGVLLLASVLMLKVLLTNKEETNYTIKTFQIEHEGWGFSIFNEEKLMIRQDIVPSIQERKHFTSQQDALNCGKLMLKKLQKHHIPSVTAKELEQNNIHL